MSRALIIVDVQNDFCEGGSLAVAGGAQVAADVASYVETMGQDYDAVVATADWHEDPGAHWSDDPDFRDSWPVHCRAGSPGAEPHPAVRPALEHVDQVFRKGAHEAAYSGFEGRDADGRLLGEWLRDHGVEAVDVVGIATDHCVRATTLDAVEAGLRTRVLLSMTAGVARETTDSTLRELDGLGVELVGQPLVG